GAHQHLLGRAGRHHRASRQSQLAAPDPLHHQLRVPGSAHAAHRPLAALPGQRDRAPHLRREPCFHERRLERHLRATGKLPRRNGKKGRMKTITKRRELYISRFYPVSRHQVFRAWTDAKHLARWWGPKDFTNPVCEIEPRVGGRLRIVMRGPDGTDYPMQGTITDIRP